MNQLHFLDHFEVLRCMKPPGFGKSIRAELHHFSDASLRGFGACSYLRLVNEHHAIHCSLVLAKCRVVPSKGLMTIPRLELQAAVTATRLSSILRKELTTAIDQEYFYTDSEIVLGYLHNDTKRFHVFVANRIQEIKCKTTIDKWHHVSSAENPADTVSRGATVEELMNSKWLSGLDILWNQDSNASLQNLVNQVTKDIDEDDPEVKRTKLVLTSSTSTSGYIRRFEKFSSWTTLVKAIAKLKLLARNWKTNKSFDVIQVTRDDLLETERHILVSVQAERYRGEIAMLEAGKKINTRPFKKFSVFLDADGILRIGGRARQSLALSYSEKHPTILPRQEHVSKLIVLQYHASLSPRSNNNLGLY